MRPTDDFVWPPALECLREISEALRKLTVAAASGNEGDFGEARYDLEHAVSEWGDDLWGKGEK